MRLSSVEIRDYRSIFVDDGGQPFRLDLAEGANTLVGQNNCGKSNVLRAVSLALDPNHPFSEEDDAPGPRPFSYPTITLEFEGDPANPVDAKVLEAAEAWERLFDGHGGDTCAAQGKVIFKVEFIAWHEREFTEVIRHETLVTRSDGTLNLNEHPEHSHLNRQAIAELRSAMRFVLISSGESLESVLEGNFREILHNVVRERLQDEFETAERSRQDYVAGLQESLLAPLRERLATEVSGLFPEVDGIGLTPDVASIETTLSNVGVTVDDLVSTPLEGKGTGVRGGLLVAMLSYLATNASRGMVFALEEPEAFLHPGAQEQLRDMLEQMAAVTGVSLLVTTHSPFIVTRSPNGRVFCLTKDGAGRTRVSESALGDADHAPLVGGLLRETTIESLLAASSAFPSDAQAVILVEGEGDLFCLKLATELVGRQDLLDGLVIRPTGGTVRMVAQAVITKAATDLPLLCLVDHDDAGRHVRDQLAVNTFGFSKKQIVSYVQLFGNKWQDFPVEAEDMFEPSLIADFVAANGDTVLDGSKKRPDGAYHYDFGQSAKELLTTWLRERARPEHVELWIELVLLLRNSAKLSVADDTAAEIVAAAPAIVAGARSPDQPASDAGALVLTGRYDLAHYQEHGAIVLEQDAQLPGGVTHVAFYSAGIQPVIPGIVDNHPNRLFSSETSQQLRSTGKPGDAKVADLIDDALRSDAASVGSNYQVLVLSPPDSPETIVLNEPIKNTKTSKGRPIAWTVSSKVVPVRALLDGPSTTDGLDAAVDHYQNVGFAEIFGGESS
jgi:energy-coupling factor transporter ATP-binding protein EcfA2